MQVVLRVDASSATGGGHLTRCLALAAAIAPLGATCTFITRSPGVGVADSIRDAGYALIILDDSGNASFDKMLDAQTTAAHLSRLAPVEWLVVDHYQLDAAWEQQQRPHIGRIMVIDDLADRPHDCDLLLDQNLHDWPSQRYQALVPSHCRLLHGPQFALLRPEFGQRRRILKARDGHVAKLLIFFGSSDPDGDTVRTLALLRQIASPGLAVDVVAGGINPRLAEIRALCATLPDCRLHVDSPDMAALMVDADLAVGAAGTASWERACLGLPTIAVSNAANQVPTGESLANMGAHLYLGKGGNALSDESLLEAIRLALSNRHLLQSLSAHSLQICDGRGAARAANALGMPKIMLRPARPQDSARIYEWRNAPATRRYFFDPAPLQFTEHEKWFEQALADPSRLLLIGSRGVSKVDFGMVRYDIDGATAVVSIFLAPLSTGQGLGPRLLNESKIWLSQHFPAVTEILARVIPDNHASISAFEQAGYSPAFSTLRCLTSADVPGGDGPTGNH